MTDSAHPVTSGGLRDARALHECVAVSRELGSDPFLVLYGGGNSSAKHDGTVFVKASGYDMGTIEPRGFAPLERDAVVDLLSADTMSDGDLVSSLRSLLLDPDSASPSIETPLHALLPHESVLHSHADAIVTLTNAVDAENVVREALGPRVLMIPYCMPGFALAQKIRSLLAQVAIDEVDGIVLQHHGIVVFGDSAREAKDRHDQLVGRAAAWIAERTGVTFVDDEAETPVDAGNPTVQALARRLERSFGGAFVIDTVASPSISAFVSRPDLGLITQRGPTTLEHVIRTKRVPMIDGNVDAFAAAYRGYFDTHRSRSDDALTMLEVFPRVALDPQVGLMGIGRTSAEARAAQTIYRHTMRIIEAAESLGGYRSISEADAFDIEYWELEQAKLR